MLAWGHPVGARFLGNTNWRLQIGHLQLAPNAMEASAFVEVARPGESFALESEDRLGVFVEVILPAMSPCWVQ